MESKNSCVERAGEGNMENLETWNGPVFKIIGHNFWTR